MSHKVTITLDREEAKNLLAWTEESAVDVDVHLCQKLRAALDQPSENPIGLTDDALDAALGEWPANHIPHLVKPGDPPEHVRTQQEANREWMRRAITAALAAGKETK